MATNYPGSIDSFNNPVSSNKLDSPSHSSQHTNSNDAVLSLQKTLGVVKILSTDVVNNDAVANTLINISALTVALESGKSYFFEINCLFTTEISTTGSRWTINGPSATFLAYESFYTLAATTRTSNVMLTAYDLPAASNATANTTNGGGNFARLQGFLKPSAAGNLVVRFASEVAGSAITAKQGSFLRVTELF